MRPEAGEWWRSNERSTGPGDEIVKITQTEATASFKYWVIYRKRFETFDRQCVGDSYADNHHRILRRVMRIWDVDPSIMCRAHLLGEHRELHALTGMIEKGISLRGYVTTGLVDTRLIKPRHTSLVSEMKRRGYQHMSPLKPVSMAKGSVDPDHNLKDLMSRCPTCAARYDRRKFYGKN